MASKQKPSHPQAHGAHLTPGAVLDGRWRLERKLGEGGMGDVWLASHLFTGKRAAIKTMKPELTQYPETVRDFFREAQVTEVVNETARHDFARKRGRGISTGPGAVDVLDTGYSGQTPYTVLELLDGDSLDKYYRKHAPLAPHVVEYITDQMLNTLRSAQSRGIVHRDLKPANVFLNSAGDVKVIDYGLSRLGPQDDAPGGFVGTPGSAAPEQYLGLADNGSDVFGAAATAYEMLTHRPPLPYNYPVRDVGNQYLQSLPRAKTQKLLDRKSKPRDFSFEGFYGCPVPPVRSIRPDVPAHLAEVIDKALACDPKLRYENIGEMQDDLHRRRNEVERRINEQLARR